MPTIGLALVESNDEPVPLPISGDLLTRIAHAGQDGLGPNISRWLDLQGLPDNAPIELQALDVPERGSYTSSRVAYADRSNVERLLAEADKWGAPGVYVVINRVDPAVATRIESGKWCIAKKGESTKDSDITHRQLLYIDIDPVRPRGTSSTETQSFAALAAADEVRAFLIDNGVPSSAIGWGTSGNGGTVLVALDSLRESPNLAITIAGLLEALAARFSTETIKIDPSVKDAKRLGPAWGTYKRKGAPGIREYPHRRSVLLLDEDAEKIQRLSQTDLDELLARIRVGLSVDQQAAIDKAMGKKPATATTTVTAKADADDVFMKAKAVDAEEAARWLGLYDGDDLRCPGCGESDGRVAIFKNGLKCLGGRCDSKGAGKGFRTTIDMVMEVRNCSPIEAVRELGARFGFEVPPPAPKPAQTHSLALRPLVNNSYLTVLTIVRANAKGVVGGVLSFNEMLGAPMLDGRSLKDSDISRIRGEIERLFGGGIDKDGRERGLKCSLEDVRHAVIQVAEENPFNPVRRYLEALRWDGKPRLDRFAADILGIAGEGLPLAVSMCRKFLIGAARRPLQPGCKHDTVFILVGPQGALKSSTFEVLAGADFFVDSPIDVSSKDSYVTLRRAWILEWAELESMQRAKNSDAVKAFITSRVDTYRPAYGRLDVQVPRTGVIVGSTNQDQFLVDETGNRRYWPVNVGTIDLGELKRQRDQLWAEAVAAVRSGEPHWLTTDEDAALTKAQDIHTVTDAWETPILEWVKGQVTADGFTIDKVLSGALEKPTGQWTTSDHLRAAKILKRAGWSKKKSHGVRTWTKSK